MLQGLRAVIYTLLVALPLAILGWNGYLAYFYVTTTNWDGTLTDAYARAGLEDGSSSRGAVVGRAMSPTGTAEGPRRTVPSKLTNDVGVDYALLLAMVGVWMILALVMLSATVLVAKREYSATKVQRAPVYPSWYRDLLFSVTLVYILTEIFVKVVLTPSMLRVGDVAVLLMFIKDGLITGLTFGWTFTVPYGSSTDGAAFGDTPRSGNSTLDRSLSREYVGSPPTSPTSPRRPSQQQRAPATSPRRQGTATSSTSSASGSRSGAAPGVKVLVKPRATATSGYAGA
ncbi:hypothetical protein H9P43_001952 [Blastocladiella emersonii ATCC 22665]|nr:hypothetical protein H9P43_001952 [Blastocladiella emersonii ATCC 22665]